MRGTRGGIILTDKKDIIEKINKAVFPGVQGGPLEHIIACTKSNTTCNRFLLVIKRNCIFIRCNSIGGEYYVGGNNYYYCNSCLCLR